jgi:hypothetical protein
MMRFIPVIMMALAVGLSPIAALNNDWFVIAVVTNIIAFISAMYVTFEADIYNQPEGKVASSILWAMFVVQLAYAILA